jgi:opacity protein-like surface antigen
MNRLFLVFAMLLALPLIAQAQELPRSEIFGGYSYMRVDNQGMVVDQDLNGFNTSYTYNFNSFLGATAEFSAFFGNQQVASLTGTGMTTVDQNNYFYLFGPKFTFRGSERFTPFAHVLVGAVTQTVDTQSAGLLSTPNNTQFAMALGGGLDISINERISLRGAQVDYVLTRLQTPMNQNNLRASAGFVLKLGEQ